MSDVTDTPSDTPDVSSSPFSDSPSSITDATVDGLAIETTVEPTDSLANAPSTVSDVPPATVASPTLSSPEPTPDESADTPQAPESLVAVGTASPDAFEQTTNAAGDPTPDTITAPTDAASPNGPEAEVTPVAAAVDVTPEVAINAAGETPATMTVDPNLPIAGDGPTSDAPTIPEPVTADDGSTYQAPANATLATNADTPAQVEPSPAKPNTFTRTFNVYRELSDDEVNTYSAGTIRESHQLGLRPTKVVVTSTVDEGDYPADMADADKPHTYVFVASADGDVVSDETPASESDTPAA
jgi:hypothetical protein